MASNLYSWRDRRWKQFENEYSNNPDLRAAVKELGKKTKEEIGDDIYEFTERWGINRLCCYAIAKFALEPGLKRNEYIRYITPPIYFWNANINEMGPWTGISALDWWWYNLSPKIQKKLTKNDLKTLMKDIAGAETIMQINPFITKSEFVEILDEYWEALSEYLNTRSEYADSVFSDKLLNKMYSPKSQKAIDRDKLILKLTNEGFNDNKIAWEVREAGYGSFDSNYIRILRHRAKQSKK